MEQVEETVVSGDDGFQFFQLAFIALFENGFFDRVGQRNPNGDKAFQDRTKHPVGPNRSADARDQRARFAEEPVEQEPHQFLASAAEGDEGGPDLLKNQCDLP